MLRAISLCLIVLTVFILSGCERQIVREYVYVPCAVPEIPAAPKYARVQFTQDEKGDISFVGSDDAKGLLVNDILNRSHIEELRLILINLKDPK